MSEGFPVMRQTFDSSRILARGAPVAGRGLLLVLFLVAALVAALVPPLVLGPGSGRPALAAPAPPLTDLDGIDFWPAGPPTASAAGRAVCEITVSLDEPVVLGGFDVEIALRAEPGLSLPDPVFGTPACVPVPGVVLAGLVRGAADDSMTATGSVDAPGFAGPGPLLSCSLDLAGAMFLPTIVDFDATVLGAHDPHSSPIEPRPSMSVTGIDCEVVGTTTTVEHRATTTAPALLAPSSTSSSSSSSSTSTVTFPALGTTTSTLPPRAACADAAGDGVTAADALAVLRAATRVDSCAACVCDVDGNGTIAATDALVLLRASIGLDATFSCPDCGE